MKIITRFLIAVLLCVFQLNGVAAADHADTMAEKKRHMVKTENNMIIGIETIENENDASIAEVTACEVCFPLPEEISNAEVTEVRINPGGLLIVVDYFEDGKWCTAIVNSDNAEERFSPAEKNSSEEIAYDTIVCGNLLAKTEKSFVVATDVSASAPGAQEFYVFNVNDDTKIYGRKGMTEVQLSEIEQGDYIQIRYPSSLTDDDITNAIAENKIPVEKEAVTFVKEIKYKIKDGEKT